MKGILYKPDMLQAIIEGRKTTTMRLRGLQEINNNPDAWELLTTITVATVYTFRHKDCGCKLFVNPYYQVGETVYCKEACKVKRGFLFLIHYSDGKLKTVPKVFIPEKHWNIEFHKKMFMPEWAARTFLKITEVKPMRLQSVLTEDAIAEGFIASERGSPTDNFHNYWNSINPSYPYSGNYWTIRYKFERLEK